MRNWIAIAAMARNRVIGNQNDIPWHLPEDFKWFKKKTTGNTLVMGRKTFDSIGKPLPGRKTIVVTRQDIEIPGVTVVHSLDEIEKLENPGTVFIGGGSEIYKMALPYCSELYLSLVDATPEGDTFFPEFEIEFPNKKLFAENNGFDIYHYTRNP